MEMIYEVHIQDGLRWQDIYLVDLQCMPVRWSQIASHARTRTHTYIPSFRNSSNIKGIISTVWEADKRDFLHTPLRLPKVEWHKYYTSWRRFKDLSKNKCITATIWEPIVLALPMRGIYDVMLCCDVIMLSWNGLGWHDIHTKTHHDRFRYLSNVTFITQPISDRKVDITVQRALRRMPLRQFLLVHSGALDLNKNLKAVMLVLLVGFIKYTAETE